MSKQEPTGSPKDEVSGLGFSKLSMNEIAPAAPAAPAEEGKRGSYAWLIAVAVLAVVIGGGWLFRTSLNTPPPQAVQDQVLKDLSATSYARDKQLIGAKFPSGDTLRLEFTATLNTENLDSRAVLRQAAVAAMKALAASLPKQDLVVLGYQGEQKVVEARYSYQNSLTTQGVKGSTDLDMSMWVLHGENDSMGETKGQTSRPGAAAGISGGN